jgi:hypothetical protein
MFDTITQPTTTLLDFLRSDSTIFFRWQTLVGALLGPFLAFLVGEAYQYNKASREAIRRVEASITQSLNDSLAIRKLLRAFKVRIQELIQEIRREQNENAYHFQEENFPPISELASDAGLSGLKLSRSLYLHNKLLWIATGIKNTNHWLQELKLGYRRLYEKNLMLREWGAAPVQQREAYANNLQNFLQAIDNIISFTEKGIKIMTQTKIYNQKLTGFTKRLVIWWHEGRSFKYFKDRSELKKYAVPLNITDRIDKILDKEVKDLIAEAERREHMYEQENTVSEERQN